MTTKPKASIVILTFNNLEYTRQCIESIYARTDEPDYEVIAVDNNSSDGTQAYLEEFSQAHPNFHLILNPVNEGFARGNNQGARVAVGDYLVFLNNDTVVTRGWLSGLIRHLEDPTVGMVGPVTNHSGNETRISVDYQGLKEMEGFAAAYTAQHAGQAFEIPMLAFLCVAMRRAVFEQIGPLDERFGVGMFEDDDYALRLKQKGYRILCAENVFIHHWGSAGFSRLGFSEYWQIFQENLIRFEEKWGLTWQPHRYRGELLGEQLTQNLHEKMDLAFQIMDRDRIIARVQKNLDYKQFELKEIEDSTSWKLIQTIWPLRLWLAPRDSARERFLQAGIGTVSRVLGSVQAATEGILNFLTRRRLARELAGILANHNPAREVIIFVPTIQWRVALFQRPHQLALAFARQGCLVFFCQPPGVKGYPGCIDQIVDNLYVTQIPFDLFEVIPSPVIFSLVYNQEYIEHFNQPRVVYEYIDELDVFTGEPEQLGRVHDRQLRSADLVVATADILYQRAAAVRDDALLCPNGVDFAHIRAVIDATQRPPYEIAELVAKGAPIIGYYGALAEWFDYALLLRAAFRCPEYSFLLIGPDYDGSITRSPLLRAKNVHWLGPKPYDELPRYLKYFDVATIPFKLNTITHSTSPLKLFEYMAGGKPPVTTAMRECEKYPGVLIAHSASEFVEKIELGLRLRSDSEYLALIEQVARENTWDQRARTMLQALRDQDRSPANGAPQ